ncbi:Ppx/GppA family phosphatase [Woodsholea maritima]|uniref:Ppx/GppA family phosphatase n=1 Tax=Woodsholea maritima TaxID=240237 RepID=UPI00037FF332|nr:Ppx/GppA family phosphatase [Woodsholea maritima]
MIGLFDRLLGRTVEGEADLDLDFAALSEAPAPVRDVAVIDIGSNTVRLVTFRLEGRALWPVFNEKITAGLGRGLSKTGHLNPEGVESALRALRRFSLLLDAKGIEARYAVATAAVRDAQDGESFVREAERLSGLTIRVLSGPEEGELSSLGVLGGLGEAYGIAGDLGGSSLEFTPLLGRVTGEAHSLRLGPLAMLSQGESLDKNRLIDEVKAQLDEVRPLMAALGAHEGPRTFYAVGGAWRAFAYIAMRADLYPLSLLHQFELDRAHVLKTAQFAMAASEATIAGIKGVSSKRAWSVPYAALLLKTIVEEGGFDRVVFSAYGLREGVVFHSDQSLLSSGDPLLAGAHALAWQTAPMPGFGQSLAHWLDPLFAEAPRIFNAPRDQILRFAGAHLADLGARMHPDHQAQLSFQEVLYAPFAGISHAERAFLALTVFHRYAGKKSPKDEGLIAHFLDEEAQARALQVGLALRLGTALCGRCKEVLTHFTLHREEERLILRITGEAQDLMVERAWHRFEQLAAVLDVKPEVQVSA